LPLYYWGMDASHYTSQVRTLTYCNFSSQVWRLLYSRYISPVWRLLYSQKICHAWTHWLTHTTYDRRHGVGLRSCWTAGLFTQRVTHRGAGIEYWFLLVVHLPAGPLVTIWAARRNWPF
jgi:hypothetical protein